MKRIEVRVPKLGMDTTEAIIGAWLVKQGDYVEPGTPLLELESEKVSFVVEAEHAGRVSEILHAVGETVPMGDILGILEAD